MNQNTSQQRKKHILTNTIPTRTPTNTTNPKMRSPSEQIRRETEIQSEIQQNGSTENNSTSTTAPEKERRQ